ncbi:hypothetical protein GIB67_032034 [Kingdonia uniflora]|uniref:CCT domain-containing protein n=1 Tax=Kingdonia uniflora TaxID=39325 RepID=A0A7J7MWK6_9MAGN|nr:hypothetical protein GIB67_032034 [Kingdonia uniflora]
MASSSVDEVQQMNVNDVNDVLESERQSQPAESLQSTKRSRKGKVTSEVWEHFTKVKDSKPHKSKCNYCNLLFASDSSFNGKVVIPSRHLALWTRGEVFTGPVQPGTPMSFSNSYEAGRNETSPGLTITSGFESCIGSSSVIPPNGNSVPYHDLSYGYTLLQMTCMLPHKECSPIKDRDLCDDDDICDGFNMDELDLHFKNDNEIFGSSQSQSNCRYPMEDTGMNWLLMGKNFLVANSYGPNDNAIEASSPLENDLAAIQSSCAARSSNVVQGVNSSGDRVLLNTNGSININLGFPTTQLHSSMSLCLSNITGESSAADYQDCGVSQMFLTGDALWDSSLETSSPQARGKAKMRYKEMKKTRMHVFRKQIRYASRKAGADTRKHVKGRFVKAGEAYDYDPLASRSC